jgi:hypothetical protein
MATTRVYGVTANSIAPHPQQKIIICATGNDSGWYFARKASLFHLPSILRINLEQTWEDPPGPVNGTRLTMALEAEIHRRDPSGWLIHAVCRVGPTHAV